jgi:hypothetical protein
MTIIAAPEERVTALAVGAYPQCSPRGGAHWRGDRARSRWHGPGRARLRTDVAEVARSTRSVRLEWVQVHGLFLYRIRRVCALLQRGPITQRNGVHPATRSRQAAACTATSRINQLP